MHKNPQLSVVVPVFNMGKFLPELVKSLKNSGVLDMACEILVVDDGSTDDTMAQVNLLQMKEPRLNLLSLGSNQGRYLARLRGAEAAKYNHILFIDARVVLAPDFAEKIISNWHYSDFIQPQAHIDVSRNLFCLYWDRSHRAIFRRHYAAMEKGAVDVTIENYDKYLKGTTAVIMPKKLFLDACQNVGQAEVLSDDTAVMRHMVRQQPLRLAPDLWYWWTPRETLSTFLWRLYDRGPGMVEYHVFNQRGWIFWSILTGLILSGLWGIVAICTPHLAFKILTISLIVMALSTYLIGRNWSETLRLAPLHVAVLFAVGLGIFKGLAVNTVRWMKGELKWVSKDDKLS